MFCNKKQQVKCEECKHYIDKEDAQKVIDYVNWHYYRIFSSFEKVPRIYYYCPLHIKPYTVIRGKYKTNKYGELGDFNYKYFKTIPEYEEEVFLK